MTILLVQSDIQIFDREPSSHMTHSNLHMVQHGVFLQHTLCGCNVISMKVRTKRWIEKRMKIK